MQHRRHQSRAGCQRTLVLVDIENLTGSPRPTRADSVRVHGAVRALAGDAQVIVASSRHGADLFWFTWPDARRLVRDGADGADLALIEVLRTERVHERFSHVILGSGDGIFTEEVARLRGHGLRVTLLTGKGGTSRRLRAGVDARVSIPQPSLPSEFTTAA